MVSLNQPNQATKQIKMAATFTPTYPEAVRKILNIYIDKGNSFTAKEQKIVCIAGLFDYLSTADVKPLLHTPGFAAFRQLLLKKIDEFSHDPYLIARRQQQHRLYAVFREMFLYLVSDDSVSPRRSERQKQRVVRHFNARFDCTETPCLCIAAELDYWSAVQPTATAKPATTSPPVVKVLPRRSARLLHKNKL